MLNWLRIVGMRCWTFSALIALSLFVVACGGDDGSRTGAFDDVDAGDAGMMDPGAGGAGGDGTGGTGGGTGGTGGGTGGTGGTGGSGTGGVAGDGGVAGTGGMGGMPEAGMPGVTVSEISGDTTEGGDQATFTVVLDTPPTADVTINLDSDDSTEGTVDTTSLTFTPDNWDAPQTVTVTGADDDIADGDQDYTIVLSDTVSDDAAYSGLTPDSVAVTNIDDETAGITVSEISGDTTEGGDQATFTVVLNSQPTADVTVNFDSNDKSEGTVDVTNLTFTADNWDAPQTATVTGVDDDEADGNQDYVIAFSATSSDDADYDGLTPGDVAVTNIDDETAGITVSEISGDTTEGGQQATFTVVLNSQPTADVTVPFDSDDKSEGTVGVTSLTFTSENWDAPQTVTVTGVDDAAADGNQVYDIAFSATTSDDGDYDGLVPDPVAVTNVDDETAGITVSAISGDTTEGGSQATFTVVLNSQPTADVTLTFDSDDQGEGTVDPQTLTFTDVNWNAPQTVTVTGADDDVADGNQSYSVVFDPASSGDTDYEGLTPGNVEVTNIDDETAGITVSEISGDTTEAGGQATFTVVLNSEPASDVTLSFDSNDGTEGEPDPKSLTFTSVNWNAPQTVTVTGQDDNVADGDRPYQIVFDAASSSDSNYDGLTPDPVAVTNIDDETAGITVAVEDAETSEGGDQATFTVVLNTPPLEEVTVNFDTNDATEGTPGTTSLTFNDVNWNAPQSVTVTGVDDDLADGDQPYAIVFGATTSDDPAYAAITPARVELTNTDVGDTPGITVTSSDSTTGEDGATGQFQVVLNSQPFDDVTVNFDSNDRGEGTPGTTSLTFTPDNWNAPQSVTVTGVDDDLADGDQPYAIVFGATTSNDGDYSGRTPGNVSFTNVDNDSAGITVEVMDATTGEGGATAEFTVVLNSQPFGDVTIDLESTNTAEGEPDTNSLTFTDVNWNAPQTVTVTGVDDEVADGDQPYAIDFTAVTSSDAAYDGRSIANVDLTNVDNDSAGITVSPISDDTTEGGGQASFTVVLNSQPFDDVTVSFDTNDPTEGVPDATSLTFTDVNWNAPQTVTLTGQDDLVADGDQEYAITFSDVSSGDAAYDALTVPNVDVTNTDNDSAGITVSGISADTTENGGQGEFVVFLNSQPTDDVTVNFDTSDASEGTVSTTSLTFTDVNWNAPQTVTVTGQDDELADGDQPYRIVFSSTTSNDSNYAAITPDPVDVVNLDNGDTAGITVTQGGDTTDEAGSQVQFEVVLDSQPFNDVVVSFDTDDATEGVPNTTSLTFTPDNWDAPQSVTVTGQDDDLADGDQPYSIVFSPTSSSDSDYDGRTPAKLDFINDDVGDTPGISVTVEDDTTGENGAQGEFSIVLDSQPFDNVTIDFMSSDMGEGVPTTNTVTFTPDNWDAPQFVSVVGQNDDLADGDQTYDITFVGTTSTDSAYAAITPANIQFTNVDDDSAGITVGPISGDTTEAGEQASFTIVLNSEPFGDVTFTFDTNDATEGIPTTNTVTFTPENWNAPQTVTITGQDDDVADGNQVYAIEFDPTQSSDAAYDNFSPANVSVTNVDDDTAGITVSAISGDTKEDGSTATFTVVLTSQPLDDVTLTFDSNDLSEGTLSTNSLTFTDTNWNATQTVTVTGVDDDLADGDQSFAVVFDPSSSSDGAYDGLTPDNVAVTNIDNDSAGIVVNEIDSETTEGGGTATFSVELTSEPFAPVTVNFDTNDMGEGTPDTTSLTFDDTDWDIAQTVTVTGVDDALADGDQPYSIVFSSTTSTDAAYAAITPDPVALTNVDNDTAGITVTPIDTESSESGDTASFSVVLNSEPFAPVTVNFDTSDSTEGVPDVTSLTFDAGNWDMAQTVTVDGIDDAVDDGDQPYQIVFSSTTSSDDAYAAITPANLDLTNNDNDTAGITVIVSNGDNETDENGDSAVLLVALNSQPTADVSLTFEVDDPTEAFTNISELTFTPDNWNQTRSVIVTGEADGIVDGDQPYSVDFTSIDTTDGVYQAVSLPSVGLVNLDVD